MADDFETQKNIAGSELFSDSESYLDELTDDELEAISGGGTMSRAASGLWSAATSGVISAFATFASAVATIPASAVLGAAGGDFGEEFAKRKWPKKGKK